MLPDGSVVLDVQGAQNRQHRDRGIARYTVEQVAGVLDHAPGAVRAVTINPDLTLPGRLDFLFGRDLLQPIGPNRPLTGEPPQLFHITSPIELDLSIDQLWPRWTRTPATQLVVTLYDLIPLVFEDHYLRDPLARARYLARLNLVRAADRVLAISRTTADDAIERLDLDADRVTVIDAGVSERFVRGYDAPEAARAVLQRRLPELREGFLLYVGGIEYRKNIERLVDGYARMPAGARRRHQLVIACRMTPEDRDRLQRHGRDLGLGGGELVLPGYVTDDELTALYHRCTLFVFPSLYEGSGLPILEAMACGAPVAASNTSTSPEILGDTEATFDPHDGGDIARVMTQVVDDAELLERLRERSRSRAARYTWSHVAMRTI
ncbi:MAG: glycosyl transferase group 1, partial [Chthonomonadaceae bacterium]|nr:glycosyl transferase group 1 [Chthonomonadaceae bacterium]